MPLLPEDLMVGTDLTARLGPGDYYLPQDRRPDSSRMFARAHYLNAVKQFAPHALTELLEKVYPPFAEGRKADPERTSFEIKSHLRDGYLKSFRTFYQEYDRWAEEHNLTEDWVAAEAIHTLWEWSRDYYDRSKVPFDHWFGGFSSTGDEPFDRTVHVFEVGHTSWESEIREDSNSLYIRAFQFLHRGCDLTRFNEDAMRRHLLGAFAIAVDEFLSRQRQDLEAAGYERTPEKRNYEHFAWTVMARVLKRPWQAIAQDARSKDDPYNVTAVKSAVWLCEDALGVPRTHRRPGRPQGSKPKNVGLGRQRNKP